MNETESCRYTILPEIEKEVHGYREKIAHPWAKILSWLKNFASLKI